MLEWDLERLEAAMHLSAEDVRTYFTDGRRVSFVLERRLTREVLGGCLAQSEGDDHDCIDTTGRKWEVRSVSAGGIYFCPSYMVGSGRRFDEAGFLQKLGSIHGYVVSDIAAFPRVPYWLIEAAVVREWWSRRLLASATMISRKRALELLATVA